MAVPGTYTVEMSKEVDGVMTKLVEPVPFHVKPLDLATFAAENRGEVSAFQRKVARLQRAVRGSLRAADEAETRVAHIRKALLDTPSADLVLLAEAQSLQDRLNALLIELRGDPTRSSRMEPTPTSISQRVQLVVWSQWNTTQAPTKTQRDAYEYAGTEFTRVLNALRTLIETDLVGLEEKLEAAGAPWTPGRLPRWEAE